MKKSFMRLMSLVLVLSMILSYNVTYAQSFTNDFNEGTKYYQTISGEKITEEELIEYIQNNVDKIYKVPDISVDYSSNLDNNYTVSAAIAIPAWAIGQWVIPLIGTIIVTPTLIKLGNQVVEAGSKLFDTIINAIERIVFSKAKVVGPKDKLPNQGKVTDKNHKNSPPVDAGKQGKHVPGHNNNDRRKSQWPEGRNGVKETQEAWENGRFVKGDNSVKTYDFGRKVGPNGETRVKVHGDSKGLIHGYPIH
ncbi:hypothetical protein [Sporanaerobacter acetigenes]|uniref:hypothetical protein n=1 Tax=Sporanaerobacter acetigenes TaxID=165813 RepID=UPI00104999C3|nr:hypothetical protein [Sporanaerobacter acetigenes]